MRRPAKNTMYAQGFTEQSSIKLETLGQPAADEFGSEYHYAQAGSTALVAGKLTGRAAVVANHANIAVATAAAIGAERVQVTLGATAATANDYEDGLLVVNDATGEGYSYRIKSHPAADSAGSLWLELAEPIQVALVAGTSEVTLVANKYKATTISSSINVEPTGVPIRAVTASYYYWSLTKGDVPLLQSGTETIGTMMIPHTTDGAVGTIAASTDTDAPIVGIQIMTGVATEYQPVSVNC